ncbi:GNAT family N-acetyltransferase [Streptomyces sp. TRM70350]|uniref:GNAT family N-acetyltransferase n=1 Tax=Streptomyces sp. TRM70350 TaxID=2856165 RepID=UPI001C463859|nr:GNAT family protein [Streptomyces sp. TRM70350]MBV7699695.1 GNAT family N-acetyltransferase [Streptomyces sp. TRM70350]
MLGLPLGDGAELRPLEPWQAQEFAAHTARIRDRLSPWLPWADTVRDTESARRWLQEFADSQANDGPRVYGILLRGELVGGTLFRLFDPAIGLCELGVWLAPEAEGRGLATRAAAALADWAVTVRGMTRVQWLVDSNNARSIAVAKRLGMSYEGTMRRAMVLTDGQRNDLQVWSVLADEWKARREARQTWVRTS